jgi:lysophospholipase L1-like esterase
MRAFWKVLLKGLKILLAALVLLEIASFLIITGSNYYIYGQFHETEAVRYDPYAIYINLKGERPTLNNPPERANSQVLTLWMFGGSTTRGVSADDSKTLPSFLARELNQVPPALPARVVNFGVDGFNSLLESKYLQKMLIESPSAPDVVIFYDGANDCTYFNQYRTPYAHHGYRQLKGLVESYHQSPIGLLKPLTAAWFTCLTRELWDKMHQGVLPLSPDDAALKEYAQSVVQRYDYVNKVARCFGATFFLIWQPFWWVETEAVTPALKQQEEQDIILSRRLALKHNFVIAHRELTRHLRGKSYFVDFTNILCSRQQPVYESDGIHLNPAGDHLVAQTIGRFLKEKLKRRPPD